MTGQTMIVKLKSKRGWYIVIACWSEWHAIVSIESKGDGSDKSGLGWSLQELRAENKKVCKI